MIPLRKPIIRKVTDSRGRPYVVALSSAGVEIREPRKRTAYLVPYGAVFSLGAKLRANLERAETSRGRVAP